MDIDQPIQPLLIPRYNCKCIVFRTWLYFISLLSALCCAVSCPMAHWTIIIFILNKLWNYFGSPCCRNLVRFPYTFLSRHFDYLVKRTALMLEIQALCEFLRLTVQLVYTSKPEVYVTHKHSTTTAHKLLLPCCESQSVNSVDRNNSCILWESCGTYRYTVWAKCRVFNIISGGIYSYHCSLSSNPEYVISPKIRWLPLFQ